MSLTAEDALAAQNVDLTPKPHKLGAKEAQALVDALAVQGMLFSTSDEQPTLDHVEMCVQKMCSIGGVTRTWVRHDGHMNIHAFASPDQARAATERVHCGGQPVGCMYAFALSGLVHRWFLHGALIVEYMGGHTVPPALTKVLGVPFAGVGAACQTTTP